MTTITAMRTVYSETQFRSRTEARYAVFFDLLRLKWKYEPGVYCIEGTDYLPDFFLPDVPMFVEIKGTKEEADKMTRLLDKFRFQIGAVALFHGNPNEHEGTLYSHVRADGKPAYCDWPVRFGCVVSGCGVLMTEHTLRNRVVYFDAPLANQLHLCEMCVPATPMAMTAKEWNFFE